MAGETADGFYIYDIWELQEQFLQYMESTIGPARRGIVDPDAPQPQAAVLPDRDDRQGIGAPAGATNLHALRSVCLWT